MTFPTTPTEWIYLVRKPVIKLVGITSPGVLKVSSRPSSKRPAWLGQGPEVPAAAATYYHSLSLLSLAERAKYSLLLKNWVSAFLIASRPKKSLTSPYLSVF